MNKLKLDEIKKRLANNDGRYFHNFDTKITPYDTVNKRHYEVRKNFIKDIAEAFEITSNDVLNILSAWGVQKEILDPKYKQREKQLEVIEKQYKLFVKT